MLRITATHMVPCPVSASRTSTSVQPRRCAAVGSPFQRVRPAPDRLDGEFGLGHALASKRLYTDGSEVLFDYAEQDLDSEVSGRSGSWSWCVAGSGLQRDCRRVPPAPRVR